jgi:membrane fusion protein (multidrug efflux system)
MEEPTVKRTNQSGGRPVSAQTPIEPVALQTDKPRRSSRKRVILLAILAVALIAGGYYGFRKYRFSQAHVDTDDAQIDGHIDPVIPRVSGYVTGVTVSENRKVSDGDVVITIDPREFQIKLETAQASLQTAEAGLQTANATLANARAALAVAQANVRTDEINRTKTAEDFARDRGLFQQGVISQQQYDASRVAAESAAAQLETVKRQVATAEAQVGVAQAQVQTAQTQMSQRQTDVDYARLQLSYTKIVAPSSGLVSKLSVEVGQFVQAGQPLLAIAVDSSVWVTANFKETDIREIHPGEPVEISVDTYPDALFHGRVESLAGATGAKFSLLPPDNATGNFVKVTQRVPVKIVLDGKSDPKHPLRPGMSADVVVTTRSVAGERN